MTVDEIEVQPVAVTEQSSGRLVVAWQHPASRLIAPVGMLDRDGQHGYRFRYLRRAVDVPGFQPFIGFPDLVAEYRSPRLFPIFSQRVMSAKRPDFGRYLDQLHLGRDATPWEQIARSEGRRTGDTVQVFPVPLVRPDGSTTCRFFVHGIRHVTGGALPSLENGEQLVLTADPTNPVNPAAVLLATADGERLGYVPDLLIEHLGAVEAAGGATVVIEHVNGPEVPVHLRLLVRLDGRVPPGYRPMTAGWETFTE